MIKATRTKRCVGLFGLVLTNFAMFFLVVAPASAQPKKNILDEVQKSVVSIRVQIIKVPYTIDSLDHPLGTGSGTGFVIDRAHGLILTNRHISNSSRVEYLEVSFFNGKETKAELIYSDPWQDFAILAVDKSEIPNEVQAMPMSSKALHVGQDVFMVGNNQAQALSIQTGTISSLYQSFGFFPNQSVRISLNSRGGSSGSPVCNASGEAVALNCGGDDTFAHALPISYVLDALPAVKADKIPARRDTGAIVGYYSLDRAVRFFKFPKAQADSYMKAFSDAKNNILIIDGIFQDAPANNVLKVGDIIWTVDGKNIGPNLYQMQKIFNETAGNVSMGVYRNGELKNLEVPTYNLEDARLKEMVTFGGATFFKADDMSRLLVDARLGEVLVGYVQPGSSFGGNIPAIAIRGSGGTSLARILSINDKKIETLETIAAMVPDLIAKRDLVLGYQNYLPSWYYNGTFQISRRDALSDVRCSGYDDAPTYFKYSDKTHKWDSTQIGSEIGLNSSQSQKSLLDKAETQK